MADERKASASWWVVLLSLCLAGIFHPFVVQAQTAPVPPGLVAWWSGEGNANDRLGSSNGTLAPGTSFVTGKVGQAFGLDGSREGVILGRPAALALQNLTFEAWVKRTSPTIATLDNPNWSGVLLAHGPAGYAFVLLPNGQLGFGQSTVNEVSSGSLLAVTDTNWHHVAVTKSGTTVVFYVDGVSKTVLGYSNVFTFGNLAGVGRDGYTELQSFYGSIDEMSVYNRALSAAEIQAIAAASGGKSYLYTIDATASSGGSISPSGSVSVNQGVSQTFTANPATGYHVASVVVDGASVGAVGSYTFSNVIANHTISASFAVNTYTITASAGINGAISPGTTTVNYGASQVVTITPSFGYRIADVLVDGVSAGAVPSYTFAGVAADHTISASFAINTYTITSSTGAGGSISPSGATSVNHGGGQAFTITPSSGYHTADVLVDGVSVGAVSNHSFANVVAAHTISASFAVDTYTITSSAGAGGSISPLGATPVNNGGSQVFTIAPVAGYHIADVLVDGNSVGAVPNYTFTGVAAAHTIMASFAINTYTITATAGDHGSISPLGATSVNHGGSQEFTITPETGYHIAEVLVDGSSVGTESSHTVANVTADHTISASFAINTYTITSSVVGANGSISPSATVSYGGSATVTISPETGYHVAEVLVDGVSVGSVPSYTFSSVTADHTIIASFAINSYTLTATAGTGGSITPLGAIQVDHGGSQEFTITPDAGYHIADVLVDGSSVGAVSSYTFADVTAEHTIVVSFAINSYTITSSAGDHGSISPLGVIPVDHGGSQEFTITPETGYHIADVLVDGISVGAVTSHTIANVTANHTISASFAVNTYTITATAGAGGSISPLGVTTVNYGADQMVDITPDAGYHIEDVLVDGVSVGAVSSHTFTGVAADHTITASFAINTYTITSSAGANGSISPSGVTTVSYGADQMVDITPDAGYHIADVLVDGVSVGAVPSYTFTGIAANHTISASFAINTYTITASAGTGGSITPLGAIPINHGGSQEFTITPETGYHIEDVLVDGVTVGVVPSYTFTGVAADHTVSASFVDQTPPTLTLNGANPLLLELGTPYQEPGATASDLVDGDLSASIQTSGWVNVNAEDSYTLTYTVSDAAHNSASATRIVQVVVTANSYGLIATHSLHLRQSARVHSGFVGVVNRGVAPFLAGKVELVVGTNVQTGPGVRLSAPRVRVRKGANIAGKLVYNELVAVDRRATITNREQVPPSYFPLFQGFGLPAFQTGTPGTQDVEVRQKGSATLSAGSYDEVRVKQKGTLTFTGGTYQLGDLEVGQQAKVIFLAPTTLLIRGQLHLDQKASFGPASGIDASQILVYVEGRNGRLGTSHDNDEGDDEEDDAEGRRLRQSPRSVKVGEQASFQGNLYAPNGTIHLRQGSTAVGAFIGRDVIVGVRVQVAAQSGWNTPGVIYQPQAPVVLAKLAGGEQALPSDTGLLANYPNPFNPSTTVPYVLAEAGLVRLSVYNVLGQQIRVLVDQLQVPGAYTVSWDGLDAVGQQVAGGVYFYRLEAGEQHAVGRMLFLK